MFEVRSIFLDPPSVHKGSFEIAPSGEHAEKVCGLFADFLMNRPPEFRDKIGFLNRGNFELDWSAVQSGSALASWFESGEPVCISVLLSGKDRESDAQMLSLFESNVLGGELPAEARVKSRPAVFQVMFPGSPEWTPVVQLLSAALSAMYFRALGASTESASRDT